MPKELFGGPSKDIAPHLSANMDILSILEGTTFNINKTRLKRRMLEVEGKGVDYTISQTNWLGGSYGNEPLSALEITVKATDGDSKEHFHLQDELLRINGEVAEEPGWLTFEETIDNIKLSLIGETNES